MVHLHLIRSHIRWEQPRKVNVNIHFHDKSALKPPGDNSAQASHGSASPCHPPLATLRLVTGYDYLQAHLEMTGVDTEQWPLCNNGRMDAKLLRMPATHIHTYSHTRQCVQNTENHQQQAWHMAALLSQQALLDDAEEEDAIRIMPW
jgi:hypothetical protein